MDINWIIDAPFQPLPVGDPNDTALSIDGRESLTYEGLRDRRDEFVALLLERDVGHGDRVGILLLNSLDYVALYFAIARLGAIAVRLNFRLAPPELDFIIRDAGCRVVVFHTGRASQLAPIREFAGVERWIGLDDGSPNGAPDWAESAECQHNDLDLGSIPRPVGEDPLMLMYTSGTTGRPKGVVWTHDTAHWVAAMQVMKWGYSTSSVTMTTGPFYHSGAFELLLLPALFAHGTAVGMSSGDMSTDRVVDTIQRVGVNHVLLYPFLLYGLLRADDIGSKDLPSLRAILSGGDPVLPWALTAIDEKFPGVQLEQGYGLTEATMTMCLDHEDRLEHPDSVGRPMPLTEARTMRPDGTPADSDEVGEVWLRSVAVAEGYWNNPEATEATFRDGWCRTGDLGRITPDGYLVLTGRAKDMIRSGGENIYPAEVEAVLAEHPAVGGVAVVAVPDERYLEVGCAVISLTDVGGSPPQALEEELRAFARDRLAGFKCPVYYRFVEELPVNASGKLQKHLLRERYKSIGSRPLERR